VGWGGRWDKLTNNQITRWEGLDNRQGSTWHKETRDKPCDHNKQDYNTKINRQRMSEICQRIKQTEVTEL